MAGGEGTAQGQVAGEGEKTPIFEYNYEAGQWVMTEYSAYFFSNEINKLLALRDTINEKWEQ